MKYAQKHDIKQLIATPDDSLAVSIFIPTHRISLPHNLKADRVRMKNAIRDVVTYLEEMETPTNDIKQYVKKLHELHADTDFWKYRDNGLAIYAQKGKMTYYDLPLEIDSSVHVGKHFIITPLLAGAGDNYRYFLLELNLESPRLFLSSQSGMEQILEAEMPGSLETALRLDEHQAQLQHGTSRGGARDAHHHGHGGEADHKDKDIEKYYRIIDRVLHEHATRNSNLPMIIAADAHGADTFRSISRYKHFTGHTLEGNYQRTEPHELHELSWDVMCKHIEEQENIFKRLFEKAKKRDGRQTLISGEHIRRAAKQGRIATLAIGIIHQTYDSVVRRMERQFKIELPSNARQLKNIEQTARHVLQTGGDITPLLYGDEESGNHHTYIKAISR